MSAPNPPTSTSAPTGGGTFRRLFVLAVALGMMTGLGALRAVPVSGTGDPLTLAAIGFVLLAAFTIGELGGLLGLPKVTGYIVAGVILGPQVADILSNAVVDDMRTFNTLALGLIAMTAGLELHIPAIRRVARTLLATVGLKVLLLPIFVGIPLALAERFVPSFGLVGWGPVLALALVVAVLGVGTSPAIALAVVNESGSKGRLTDLLLGMAVVKDLVVVTCLAIAIAVARSMLGGGAMDAGVLVHLGIELGGSVAVGAAVGGLLILYFRYVRVEPLFSMLVMVLVVAELTHSLHLELLLVFIAAGFVVRNFSPFEHEALDPLVRISLPVFVVFFTTAGAGVDLRGTVAILPLAIGLVVMRAGTYWLAARLGGKIGGEAPQVANNAWLTYLPQAGVTLGLVLLAAKALPELEQPITRLGLALVTLNLLVGPVTLAMGLGRAGETAAARAAAGDAPAPDAPATAPAASSSGPAEPAVAPASPAGSGLAPARELALRLGEPALASPLHATGDLLMDDLDRFAASVIDPLAAALQARGAALMPDAADGPARVRLIRAVVQTAPEWRDGRVERSAAAAFDGMVGRLRALPWRVEAPLDPALLAATPGDGRVVAFRRARGRLGARVDRLRGQTPMRSVPFQLALRIAVEPRLAEAVVVVCASLYRADAALGELARKGLNGSQEQGLAAVPVEVERWRELAVADLRRAVLAGLAEAVATLQQAGGPAMPARDLRFAQVESQVSAALVRLADDGPVWRDRCARVDDGLLAAAFVASAARVVGQAVDQRAAKPVRDARAALLPVLAQVAKRLEAIADLAAVEPAEALDVAQVEQIGAQCSAAVDPASWASLGYAAVHFRRQTQAGLLVNDLAEVVRNAPERCVVVSAHTPVARAERPGLVDVRDVALGGLLDAQLHDDLLPSVSAALGPVAELVASCDLRVREGVAVAAFGAQLAARGGFETAAERQAVLVDAVRRGAHRVQKLHDELELALVAAEGLLSASHARARQRFDGLLDVGVGRSGVLVRHTLRHSTQVAELWARGVLVRLSAQVGGLVRRAVDLTDGKSARDLRIRSGRERLDATAMAAYVAAHLGPAAGSAAPAIYGRLMATTPVTERRMFVVREELLARLVDGFSDQSLVTASTTLLVGPEGAGCTSLMQMVQMQLVGPRVIWLDQTFASRSGGPLQALAAELGVSVDAAQLNEALVARPTAVMIDSLEVWLEPGEPGAAALDALLLLMHQTRGSVRWLLAVNDSWFRLNDELMGLQHRFAQVITLPPMGWEALQALIDRRAEQGGFDALYGHGGWRNLARERTRPGREKEHYFRGRRPSWMMTASS